MIPFILVFAVLLGVSGAADSKPGSDTLKGIASNCNAFHTVKKGDDCDTVVSEYDITRAEFLKWNPAVSKDCSKNFWVTYAYCVGIDQDSSSTTFSTFTTKTQSRVTSTTAGHGQDTTTTIRTFATRVSRNTSTKADTTYSIRNPVATWELASPTEDTEWPPQRTQEGQPSNCKDWHKVERGDTCESIVLNYGNWRMTVKNFKQWNPTVLDDCSGLFIGWWVCINAPMKHTTTKNFGFHRPSTTVSIPDYTPKPSSTIDWSWTPSPTHEGASKSCKAWHQAKEGDTCDFIISRGYISKDDFYRSNPGVESQCDGLDKGYYYCAAAHMPWEKEYPMPPTVTAEPTVVPSGQTRDCKAWYKAAPHEDCELILLMFYMFSLEDFVKWNPSVGKECSKGIVENQWYCVGVPGSPTTRTGIIPSPTPVPKEDQTQKGMAKNCNRTWQVTKQDTCDSIIKHIGITEEQFFAWNPAIGDAKKHTCDNLKVQYWVCIGVQHAASRVDKTTATSASAAPTFTSSLNSTTFGSGSTTATQTSLLYTASSESLTSSEPGVTFITKAKSSVKTSDSTLMTEYSETSVPGTTEIQTSKSTESSQGDTTHSSTLTADRTTADYGKTGHEETSASATDYTTPGHTKSTRQGATQSSTSTADCSAPESTISYTNPPGAVDYLNVETSDCPDGPHFTTEIILVSTTVCPVTEIGTGPQHTQLATFIPDASASLYPPAPNPTSSAASISSAPNVKHPIPTEATASTRPSAVVSDGLGCPAPVATPLPREDCMIGGCKRFYLVQEGDYCTKISRGAGISIEDFYEWNPSVSRDCSDLYLGYWYCIGTTGPAARISSAFPDPTW
ncbi:hypothetical protein MRS44_004570 [Fusarium solani]|uniref:uncharacterized protein n=1 Tax=Fusarium solani TaxID=169388 RepID=UPI0032C4567E|nr:hypothetical protein MRS44_004570 [Fusarium solani]